MLFFGSTTKCCLRYLLNIWRVTTDIWCSNK